VAVSSRHNSGHRRLWCEHLLSLGAFQLFADEIAPFPLSNCRSFRCEGAHLAENKCSLVRLSKQRFLIPGDGRSASAQSFDGSNCLFSPISMFRLFRLHGIRGVLRDPAHCSTQLPCARWTVSQVDSILRCNSSQIEDVETTLAKTNAPMHC